VNERTSKKDHHLPLFDVKKLTLDVQTSVLALPLHRFFLIRFEKQVNIKTHVK
jgi:hypothetical protein